MFSMMFSILLIIIIFISLISWLLSKSKSKHPIKNNNYQSTIISTIKDKSTIPDYIYENRKKYAPNSKYIVFDDNECIQFLLKHYGTDYVNKFNTIRNGAHKADLFRYAYLYKYGGLYVDIKTVFIKDISTIFKDKNMSYFVITPKSNTLYNGIIYTPPKNEMIFKMLQSTLTIHNSDEYFYNLRKGLAIMKTYLVADKLALGMNRTQSNTPDVYIFHEKFFDKEKCDYKNDRYGHCTFVVNKSLEPIIKVRDVNYTPNYL